MSENDPLLDGDSSAENPTVTTPNQRDLRRIAMRRARQFAEPLLVNEGVRQNLHDAQAKKLIGWATARLEMMAEMSAMQDDAAAVRLLDTLAKGVTGVIRQIDALMGDPATANVADEFQAIAANSAELDKEALFEKLFTFATQPPSQTTTTEQTTVTPVQSDK